MGNDPLITCTICTIEKPLEAYYPRKEGKHGRRSQCRECESLRKKARYIANKPQHLAWAIASHYRRNYGLEMSELLGMAEAQGFVCAICRGRDENKQLAVDHCHGTGKIRGLLCQRCNVGIGNLRDDVNLLKSAIKYLEKYT